MSHPIEALLRLMSRLRDPELGCPWDQAQTFSTIAPYTIEEAYEVVDAIEEGDFTALREELGDLLLQVIYHAQMADEQSLFDFNDVVEGLYQKLIRRHPHLFDEESGFTAPSIEASPSSPEQVNQWWEEVKRSERQESAQESAQEERSGAESCEKPQALLEGVSRKIPALTRSVKLQKRAAQVGFDWETPHQVIDKFHEELGEIEEAMAGNNRDAIEDELGDLLFVCTNLARKLSLDPEMALRRANRKFEERFERIEALLHRRGIPVASAGIELLSVCWDEVKEQEKGGAS